MRRGWQAAAAMAFLVGAPPEGGAGPGGAAAPGAAETAAGGAKKAGGDARVPCRRPTS